MIAQPAVMAAPWRDSAGDLLDVRYSGLGNIAHRAGKGALIIRVNTHIGDPQFGQVGRLLGSEFGGVCVMALPIL
jgi:hypothetical protein